jgi:Tol biopolymer transport system component
MPRTKNAFVLFFTVFFIALTASSVDAQKSVAYLTEPSLSPDRREIAFVSGGDVWTVPAVGGTAQLLVSHPATEARPMYSPDGRRLAFTSSRTGNGDVYVVNLETGDLARMTFDDAGEQLDAWSRDGNWLYFSSSSKDIAGMSDIFRVSANGGTPMQFSSDRYVSEFHSAPSPDGAGIVFSTRGFGNGQWWRKGRSHIDESEIWMKRDGTNSSYEQISQRGAKQLWTMWSADGSRIYFVSDRSGAQNIWTQPLKGQAKQLTNFTDGRVLWANISYDGKQIVFERNFKIWQMNTDGKASEVPVALRGTAASPLSDRVNLSTQIREFSLSPDGKKVAVVARGEIFAASAKDGGEAVRLTKSAAPESFAAWSTDSRKIAYVSERDGKMQIYQYDFATETETPVTKNGDDVSPVFSPDGKYIAFIRTSRQMFVYDLTTKQEREVGKLVLDKSPFVGKRNFVWSPDSKWLAFFTGAPESRSYTNVSVVPVSGGAAARPISFLANSNAGSLSWSPDGTFILFSTSQRTEQGSLARVDLKLRTPKFREDQFRELFREESPKQKTPPAPVNPSNPNTAPSPIVAPSPNVSPNPSVSPSPSATPNSSPLSPSSLVGEGKTDEDKSTTIVFEDIRRRLSLLPTGVDVNGQVISPDGKSVLVLASSEGQFNLYVLPLDELATDSSAKQLTSTATFKSDAQFSPDSKEVFYLENGRINVVTLDRREIRPLALNLDMNVNFAQEKMEVFGQGWRFMRDNFFDEKFNGADWNAVRQTYEPLVAGARTGDEVRRLMSLMVGELNASHLGVNAPNVPGTQPIQVGKLGLRFDRAEYETNGRLKITEIIALTPSAVVQTIKVGDYLVGVDGVQINRQTNLDELLEGKVGRRTILNISSSADGANKREVILKPISTNQEKTLLYRQWVEDNRAYVARISNNRLGYVHLPDMSSNSLSQLYVDLDAENEGKQGVVFDIRNNNGGFVNPYAIDVLSRRGYLNFQVRDQWTTPARSSLGQRSLERPTILVMNQYSLSDAEDFAEGYRALKLGKIVGEPTAGWIVFTSNVQLFDGTTLRIPFVRVTDSSGKDLEMNPRPVDVAVTRPIGETFTNQDTQLQTAVRELLGQVGKQN